MQHSCSHYNAICNHPSSRSSLNRTPPFKVKSQSDLQAPFIKVMSRSSLNRTPPFKIKSQSRSTLQGQVSIRSATTLHQGHVKSHSRSSLNRTPPFKIKSQSRSTLQGQVSIRSATTLHQGHVKSHTTLQGQLSIAHHPSRSSLNRTPPFKIKSQSRTTLQGQVSIAHHPSHHPSRSSVNRAPPFLNRAPPFKVKSQSHTTLQGQVSIAHHPSSFQDSEFYLSVPRKYCFPTSFDNGYMLVRKLARAHSFHAHMPACNILKTNKDVHVQSCLSPKQRFCSSHFSFLWRQSVCVCVYHLNRCKTSYYCRGPLGDIVESLNRRKTSLVPGGSVINEDTSPGPV